MKLFSILLIIFFNKISFSINSKSECLIRLETVNNLTRCLSSECSKYSNPLRILESSCQINNLQLSFTNYSNFLDFIQNQVDSDYLLEQFFIENNHQTNTIQINIDYLNSADDDQDFLSLGMLLYLGGEIEIIHIFKLKIHTWKQTQTNNIIFIHENILFEQPFQEIQLTFYCNSKSILVEWILYKHKKNQLNSPCPTQIQIQSENHSLQLDYRNNDLSKIEMDHQDNHSIINNKHLIDNNDKTHYGIYATKIIVPICLIVLGITFSIYYFVYLPHRNKRDNKYFYDNDIATAVSEATQSNIE